MVDINEDHTPAGSIIPASSLQGGSTEVCMSDGCMSEWAAD